MRIGHVCPCASSSGRFLADAATQRIAPHPSQPSWSSPDSQKHSYDEGPLFFFSARPVDRLCRSGGSGGDEAHGDFGGLSHVAEREVPA